MTCGRVVAIASWRSRSFFSRGNSDSGEARVLDDVGDDPGEGGSGVAEHGALDRGLIFASGDAERAAHAGDRFRDRGGRVRCRALLQKIRHQVGEPHLLRALVDRSRAQIE